MIDYYESGDEGCCLNCPNAEPGCLCFQCKCSQCYWYSLNQQISTDGGYCVLANFWREEREEEEDYSQSPNTRYLIDRIHKETNKAVLASFIVVDATLAEKPRLSKQFWIPKTIIIDENHVPMWFSDKNRFIEHEPRSTQACL